MADECHPAQFRAYVVTSGDDGFERGVRDFAEGDLPPGEVEVRVAWSSVNYKDGWPRSPTARSPGSARSSLGSTSPARS